MRSDRSDSLVARPARSPPDGWHFVNQSPRDWFGGSQARSGVRTQAIEVPLSVIARPATVRVEALAPYQSREDY
jgi:hypothetical protein